jgi:transcriptional regulator of arginine metabolism
VSQPDRRRQAAAELIRSRRIGTQEELLAALRGAGFDATQATLSRDLARLGARRVSAPEGGARYELDDENRRDGLHTVAGLVASVASNGAMVVVRTHPGSAPAVARALDLSGLPEVLGTIAGDDTIFVAPADEGRAKALAELVRRLFRASGARGPRPAPTRAATAPRSPRSRAR